MQEAIEKADTLIEALSWIRQFRDKTTVIKLGGSVIDEPEALRNILIDVVFMETVGMRPVIVHGAGKRISAAMQELGMEPRFVMGRRFTDEPCLQIVRQVLAEQTNREIAECLEQVGGRAMTLNFESTCVLGGDKIDLMDENGEKHDLGWVGEVSHVDRLVIDNLCYAGQVPVIPSMCQREDGQIFNVNADSAAIEIAKQIHAEKLIVLSDVAGLLRDPNDPDSQISTVNETEVRQLLDQGVIQGGMIPKIQGCLEALQQGVNKVHIVDGRVRHSLLLEIYTSHGIGTQIVKH